MDDGAGNADEQARTFIHRAASAAPETESREHFIIKYKKNISPKLRRRRNLDDETLDVPHEGASSIHVRVCLVVGAAQLW